MKTNKENQFYQVECIGCREQVFNLPVDNLNRISKVAFRCPKCSCTTLAGIKTINGDEPVLVISKNDSIEP